MSHLEVLLWFCSLPLEERDRIAREAFREADRRGAVEDALAALSSGCRGNWTFTAAPSENVTIPA
jgi:hypothetical protein